MTQTNEAPKKQQPGERTPIEIELLLISHDNPHGVRLPTPAGGDKMEHKVVAGELGDIKTVIEFLPWMRRYRVTRYQKEGANDKVTWKASKPFYIPETWCVHVEAE
ncbi:MAG: hypothetical protein HOV80_36150 [Polyangiaceae bacterium]|nr:hypothetical protein [Polyangiaceae bacterium]